MVALIGWYLIKQQGAKYTQPPQTPTYTTQPAVSPQATSAATTAPAEKNVVKITSSGFLPQNITIKTGESVRWVNDETLDHAVNSAVHPTHLLYPPLNLGLIKSGEEKSLEFPTAGTYKYHDHLNPSLTGSVTVQ